MDKTAERVGKDLRDQPDVEAELRSVIGDAYFEISNGPQAVAMHREALAIYRRLLGDKDRQVASSLQTIGYELSEYREKTPRRNRYFARRLPCGKKWESTRARNLPEALGAMALVLARQGEEAPDLLKREKIAEAESCSNRRSLTLWRGLQGNENMGVAHGLTRLALILNCARQI